MTRTSHLLSNLSEGVGIVISPSLAHDLIKHIEFVRVREGADPGDHRLARGHGSGSFREDRRRTSPRTTSTARPRLPQRQLQRPQPRRHPRGVAQAHVRGEGALRPAAPESRSCSASAASARRRRIRGLRRGDVEHDHQDRLRRHRADARAFPRLRGEEPARPAAQRVHRPRLTQPPVRSGSAPRILCRACAAAP